VFQFTLGGDRERLAAVLPGVLWLGFVLSALLRSGGRFSSSASTTAGKGCCSRRGTSPPSTSASSPAIWRSCWCGRRSCSGSSSCSSDIDLGRALPGLLVVVLLGTLGLAAVGTLFAAMTANVRARELLFPVLLLPRPGAGAAGEREGDGGALARRAPRRRRALGEAARRRRRDLRRREPAHVDVVLEG